MARRTGAFADAVARLEQGHPREAASLRLLWADTLAQGGDYAAAVDVIWKLEPARALAKAWIDNAIEVGGVTAGRMLARKVRLGGDTRTEAIEQCRGLLDDDLPESLPAKEAFATELVAGAADPAVRPVLRLAARALLASREAPALAESAAKASRDPAFALEVSQVLQQPQAGPSVRPAQDSLPVTVQAYGISHAGAGREKNEDCFVIAVPEAGVETWTHLVKTQAGPRGAVLAVFDGCGSMPPFSPASVAREQVSEGLKLPIGGIASIAEARQRVAEAIQSAGRAIFELNRTHRSSLGSTATVALLWKHYVIVGHVGDSRAYLLRNGVLSQITHDHTVVQELRDTGQLSQTLSGNFKQSNVITRAVGLTRETCVDLFDIPLCRADRLLFCTDGVYKTVHDDEIRPMLAPEVTVPRACEELALVARVRGAGDDATLVVAEFTGPGLQLPEGSDCVVRLRSPDPKSPSDLVHRVPLHDTGAIEVFDAALLPDGKMVLALGELGVRLVSAAGKTIVHLAEPAHRLVLSDHGDRVLALARRGDVWRIARVDLRARRAESWVDARLRSFAATFDGATWVVGQGSRVHVIDVLDQQWGALCSVELAADHIERKQDSLALIEASRCELRVLNLPSLQVQARREIPESERELAHWSASALGQVAAWRAGAAEELAVASVLAHEWHDVGQTASGTVVPPVVGDRWTAFPSHEPDGWTAAVIACDSHVRAATLVFEGAKRATVRLQDDILVACVTSGRSGTPVPV